jgi:hypothetical protein
MTNSYSVSLATVLFMAAKASSHSNIFGSPMVRIGTASNTIDISKGGDSFSRLSWRPLSWPEQIPDDRERRDQQHAHDHAAADAVHLQALRLCPAWRAASLTLARSRRSSGKSAITASCGSGIVKMKRYTFAMESPAPAELRRIQCGGARVRLALAQHP